MSSNSATFDEEKTQKMPKEIKNVSPSFTSKSAVPSPPSSADEILPEIEAFSKLSIGDEPKAAAHSSPVLSPKWTVWRYDCRDFPQHMCFKKPCRFCEQVGKLKGVSKGKSSESTDRWDSYLKREKSYEDKQILIKVMDGFLPSKLAKDVFFNRKLGVALFRGDIQPKSESVENVNGVVFQLLLLATSGRKSASIVSKFDTIFSLAIRLTLDLPSSVGCHVNGIFLRCEMNPGKGLDKEANPYGNLMDLPFMAKLEVWIRNRANRTSVWETLISEIKSKIDELALPFNAFRAFITINRVENWTKETLNGKFVDAAQFGVKKSVKKAMENVDI